MRQDSGYLYDAEGRVCAVDSTLGGVTLYLYNADGTRVAKGSGSFSCDLSSNGFTVTHRYILDMAGRQMTEYDGSGNWLHSNVFANGELLATYSSSGNSLSFALNDWLGTKRVQAKADGEFDLSFVSLPYGDQMVSSTGATEQLFTGKERDTESGNDYFGARYYGSTMGRMLSPDPLGGSLINPQSLNRYAYALNNPLRFTDPTGMYVTNCASGDKKCAKNAAAFEKSRQRDLRSKNAAVRAAAGAYGNPGQKNGVNVVFGDPGKGKNGTTTPTGLEPDPNHPGQFRADINVTIRPGQSSTNLDTTVGHEGQHVGDAQGFAATVTSQGYYDLSRNLTELQTEINAYHISNDVLSEEGVKAGFGTCGDGPCVLGYGVTNPDAVIRQLLANPANGYGVTPANPGPRQFPEITTPNPVPQ